MINIVLIISLGYILLRSGVLASVLDTQDYNNPQYDQRLSLFETIDTQETDIVFLGDSITERSLWNEFFPDVELVNRGIGSDTTQGVLDRMDNVIKLNPQKIFLNIGVNDISTNIDEGITVSNIQTIINKVSTELPESELYLQSVFPVRNDYSPVNNSDIDQLNLNIQKLARENDLRYLDIANALKNKNGSLQNSFTVDGIHLTGDAYLVWYNYLKEYIY